ncbi:leucyl-tRNA synthetase [Hymenobacter roseosalivarius DSM 11622]|uniref:Leucine--tRNA ligase n=1 Tax=Hymenobacter roseosalivarius DSM 11622 TaxID=645990 RepID=A0A1W1W0H6_9BACT|nr:class I tRNA ligase family protein [Hymenobacter roseosalivarius]SMB99086.1 leucyl-tRNA synthetase [Hymenobacter roseosalivarius DSM 11622]
MPAYRPEEIEKKWQAHWKTHKTFEVSNSSDKPKYYVLDMFPYPSGAGLHVGHPLGYIASDIVSRFKRLQGFNVLHPMGFDSFGLPAEQYAIQTGQHPEKTTRENIQRYIEQLSSLGFSYDWSREIRTSDARYYKWTQWIFLKLFNSWYNLETNRAESIRTLQDIFGEKGSAGVRAAGDTDERHDFTAGQWQMMTEKQRIDAVHPYRLAYQSDTYVNWCAVLGTVLSNDEVKDGLSERGGYPVERRLMPQWNLRITAYADRLLQGLDTIDWPEPVKEMQRNWIGRSVGAEVTFPLQNAPQQGIKVYTTRVDTIYGATFMVLAPEHELAAQLTTPEQKEAVDAYVLASKRRSERDRMADTKTVSGVFTGSYALNPVSGEPVPVWLADYVLAGYGTGAVMAVPSGDQRDYLFAKHFDLPIVAVTDAQQNLDQQADPTKEGHYINSELINGLAYKEATDKLIAWLEEHNLGKGKVNFRLRDAIFGRQRYWGEPLPIYYKEGLAYGVAEADLPIVLPEIDEYKPTETGEPPLGRAQDWKYRGKFDFELSTMPGWAGSSWYYLRYMDPHNDERFVGEEAEQYWQTVDLYMGGAEHATGHLLYSRFWYLFLKDLGLVSGNEPFQKLINQGMILGRSNFVYYLNLAWGTVSDEGVSDLQIPSIFISKDISERMSSGTFSLRDKEIVNDTIDLIFEKLKSQYTDRTIYRPETEFHTIPIHVDVTLVENDVINVERLKAWRPDFANATFICEPDGSFVCNWEVEKMSKSKHNVVNPDDLISRYGADALRLYEMFLGPLEQFKPWNTSGMSGVSSFLKKLWRLFHPEDGKLAVTDEAATPAELKALHKAIKKAQEDIERFSFNTSVSTFMIAVNELTALNCHKRAILEPLTVIISPYAPHLAEELWAELGHEPGSITNAQFPVFEEKYLEEASIDYPISFNGKMRGKMTFAAAAVAADIEKEVLASEIFEKFSEGKAAKKVIVVPGRMVNVVV